MCPETVVEAEVAMDVQLETVAVGHIATPLAETKESIVEDNPRTVALTGARSQTNDVVSLLGAATVISTR